MTQFTNSLANSEWAGATVGSLSRALTGTNATISQDANGRYLVASSTASSGRAHSLHWQPTGYSGCLRFEFTLTAWTTVASSTPGWGFCNNTVFNNKPGVDTNGVSITANGLVFYNNASLGSAYPLNLAQGDVIQGYYDQVNGKVWFRVIRAGIAGGWNNDIITNQNPANGTGGYSAPITGDLYTNCRMNVSTDVTTFNYGDITYANSAPAGVDFQVGALPTGWTLTVSDSSQTVGVASITTSNGQTTAAFSFNIATPPAGTVTAYINAGVQPITAGTTYTVGMGSAFCTTGGTITRSIFAHTYTDNVGGGDSGQVGASTISTTGAQTKQTSFVAGVGATYASYGFGVSWPVSQITPTTLTIACPMLVNAANLTTCPYIPTTTGPVTVDWRVFTTLGSLTTLTVNGGGGNDPPSGTTSVILQGWCGGGGSGATTSSNGAGGGGGGCFARRETLSVVNSDTISFTIPSKVTTSNSTPGALVINKNTSTAVLTIDGPTAANGQTAGAGGLAANCTGATTAFNGGNGGNGATAGGGGGASPSQYGNCGSATAAITTTVGVFGSAMTGSGGGANGRSGALSGAASSGSVDPGGACGGNGANNTSYPSNSRGEVWVGWIIAGGVNYNATGVAGAGAAASLSATVIIPPAGVTGTGSAALLVPKVTDTLTGVFGTGTLGALADKVQDALSGVTGTGVAAGPSGAVQDTLSGVSGAGIANPLSSVLVTILGVNCTGVAGLAGKTVADALFNVAGAGQAGALNPSIAASLTGVAGSGAAGVLTVTTGRNVSVIGVSAAGLASAVAPSVNDNVSLAGASGVGQAGPISGILTGDGIFGVSGVGIAGLLNIRRGKPRRVATAITYLAA